MGPVFIKISDSGWIIEEMARRLTESLPGVVYDYREPGDSVSLVYYLPYLTYTTRPACPTIGYFTHREVEPHRGAIFDRNAGIFDWNVCQSRRTAAQVAALGHSNWSILSPGVDLERFVPEIHIGVVGRTYDSGRKGEQLLAEVLDLPGFRWSFTGTGWPRASRFLSAEEMPAFYRSVDYILVPSTNEGGPMCVLEALACGVEVIAPDVGWVNEFPHIPYETGNAASLRRVLLELWDQRIRLRRTVLDRTWNVWIHEHDRLFRRLLVARDCPS